MLYQSIIEARGPVLFPEYTGERVYMEQFDKKTGLPKHLSRWRHTVDAMLDGIEYDEPIYIMIDQSEVKAGNAHRRSGVHIDGYWHSGIHAHGDRRHSAYYSPKNNGKWEDATFDEPEAIILASDISAACGYIGFYNGPVGEMGDCSRVDVSGLGAVSMLSNRTYAGNVNCLHESLPVVYNCLRTLVRLNVPGWTPKS